MPVLYLFLALLVCLMPARGAELPELYSVEAIAGNRILAISAQSDEILVLSYEAKILSRSGGSGSREGYRSPSEADARLGVATLLADRDNDRVCRLDAHLTLQGEVRWPASLSPDFLGADLLALSDTRLLVLADRRRGGVLLLDNLDQWRPLWDSRDADFAGRLRALECLGETVLLVRGKGQDAELALTSCDAARRQTRAWPYLSSVHRSLDNRSLLFAVQSTDSLRLHRLEGALLADGLPVTCSELPVCYTCPSPKAQVRDFLLLPGGLLLVLHGEEPRLVPSPKTHTDSQEQVHP